MSKGFAGLKFSDSTCLPIRGEVLPGADERRWPISRGPLPPLTEREQFCHSDDLRSNTVLHGEDDQIVPATLTAQNTVNSSGTPASRHTQDWRTV